MKKTILSLLVITLLFTSCKKDSKIDSQVKKDTQVFLDVYSDTFKSLYYKSAEAEWAANTHIVEGDTLNAYNVQKANEAYATFTGSKEVIEKTRGFLEKKDQLDLVQIRQLESILYSAANNPETVSEIVKERKNCC